MSDECNHMGYQRVVFVKQRKRKEKICITCAVSKMQEESGLAFKNADFNIYEYRLARNQLEMEKILVDSGENPIPSAYIEYREELLSRGSSIVRREKCSDLIKYDHTQSVNANPVSTPSEVAKEYENAQQEVAQEYEKAQPDDSTGLQNAAEGGNPFPIPIIDMMRIRGNYIFNE